MTFDPTLAFIRCPKCAADERHVHHVSREAWACNVCGSGFEVRREAGNALGRNPASPSGNRDVLRSPAAPQLI